RRRVHGAAPGKREGARPRRRQRRLSALRSSSKNAPEKATPASANPVTPAAVAQLWAWVRPETPVSANRTDAVRSTSAGTNFPSTASVATETTSPAAAANRNRLSAFDGPGAPAGLVIDASASASQVAPSTAEPVAAASSPRIQPQTEG